MQSAFVRITNLIASKIIFVKRFFVIILAAMVCFEVYDFGHWERQTHPEP